MCNNKLIVEKVILTDRRARLETALYIKEITDCPQGLLCPGHPTHDIQKYVDTIIEEMGWNALPEAAEKVLG